MVLQTTVRPRRKKSLPDSHQTYLEDVRPEDVVVFTSFDGTVREVGALPSQLGRATALASERTLSKIWGLEEEAKDCQSMLEER